jgi:acyl dehydratase
MGPVSTPYLYPFQAKSNFRVGLHAHARVLFAPMAATVEVNGIEELKALQGKTVGPTDWRTITQEDIDTFAQLSGDDQWIHVDVERATKESPFGTTIAHGNLTLSAIDGLRRDLISSTGFKLGVNYGWNKVRFPAPVPAGARIRATAEVVDVDDVGGGWWQIVTRFTVEVEGNDKPCCVADSVGRALPA